MVGWLKKTLKGPPVEVDFKAKSAINMGRKAT